jgi:hypothetical protein
MRQATIQGVRIRWRIFSMLVAAAGVVYFQQRAISVAAERVHAESCRSRRCRSAGCSGRSSWPTDCCSSPAASSVSAWVDAERSQRCCFWRLRRPSRRP